jgi:LysM repeat protein
MKFIPSFVALALFLVGTAWAEVAPPLAFSGVLRDEKGFSVVLSDTATGESQWLTAGQIFKGYLLVSYDADASTVLLRKDGTDVTLHLNDAKVSVVPLTFEERQAMIRNLRRLFAAQQEYFLENGKPPSSLNDLVGASKRLANLLPIRGEDYSGIVFTSDMKKISVKAASGETVSYDEGLYIVQRGDTGAAIARANNISLADLRALNPDVEWNKIGVGQAVRIHP